MFITWRPLAGIILFLNFAICFGLVFGLHYFFGLDGEAVVIGLVVFVLGSIITDINHIPMNYDGCSTLYGLPLWISMTVISVLMTIIVVKVKESH